MNKFFLISTIALLMNSVNIKVSSAQSIQYKTCLFFERRDMGPDLKLIMKDPNCKIEKAIGKHIIHWSDGVKTSVQINATRVWVDGEPATMSNNEKTCLHWSPLKRVSSQRAICY